MKVEINPNLISSIENCINGGCNEKAIELLKEVANAIEKEKIDYENHVEDLIDSVNL